MSQVTKDPVAILLGKIFGKGYRHLPLKAKGEYIIVKFLCGIDVLEHLDDDQKSEFDKFYETLSSEQQKKVKDFLHKELQVIAKQIYTKALNDLKKNPQNAEAFFILLQFATPDEVDNFILGTIFMKYYIFQQVVNEVMSKEELERMLVNMLKENGEVYVRYVIEKPSLDVYINLLEIFLEKQSLTCEDIQCLEELFEFIALRRSVNIIKGDIKFLRHAIQTQRFWAVDVVLNIIKERLRKINLTWEDIGISESEVQRWEDFSKL